QKTITLSTYKAEYIALCKAIKESIYLYNSFSYIYKELELKLTLNKPIILIDNKAV
ncbi:hypothetical protein LZ30DRAFT_606063, partial [Colletotrichum cereale]